tara:strand:- start:7148 stop:7348 length:201 start_codon:yes stop_codon:yes gene_type:complete
MKRELNESYDDYKKRRSEDNKKTKVRLKGLKVWPGDWGTYSEDIHGKIETRINKIIELKNKINKDD